MLKWRCLKNATQNLAFVLNTMFRGRELEANAYLITWFIANITITISSKSLFHDFSFPYPMALTAIHLLTTGLVCQICSMFNNHTGVHLTAQHYKSLILFSFIFTINIWLSNYSLMVVSVPVHQVLRTTVPLFTMLLSLLLYKERYPLRMIPAVLVVIMGVIFTVTWDINLSLYGGTIALLGCAFSSLKGLMSQKAQIGSQGLATIDLLRAVCPLSVMQLAICSYATGELGLIADNITSIRQNLMAILILQGFLAAGLNFVSFKCAALKNPLTMNIAGNVKQVVTPLVSLWVFGGSLTFSLSAGLITTFIGAVWYGKEAQMRKMVSADEDKCSALHELALTTPGDDDSPILDEETQRVSDEV